MKPKLKCVDCEETYILDRSKGHQLARCNSCNATRRRRIIKAKCVEYLGGKCKNCGYSKCLRALDFHHRDPKTKKFKISDAISTMRAWDKVEKELNKCDLLCANCHMEVEHSLS